MRRDARIVEVRVGELKAAASAHHPLTSLELVEGDVHARGSQRREGSFEALAGHQLPEILEGAARLFQQRPVRAPGMRIHGLPDDRKEAPLPVRQLSPQDLDRLGRSHRRTEEGRGVACEAGLHRESAGPGHVNASGHPELLRSTADVGDASIQDVAPTLLALERLHQQRQRVVRRPAARARSAILAHAHDDELM